MKKINYVFKDISHKTPCPYSLGEIKKAVGGLSCFNCAFYIGHSKKELAVYCLRNEISIITSPRLLIVEKKMKYLRKNYPKKRKVLNIEIN